MEGQYVTLKGLMVLDRPQLAARKARIQQIIRGEVAGTAVQQAAAHDALEVGYLLPVILAGAS